MSEQMDIIEPIECPECGYIIFNTDELPPGIYIRCPKCFIPYGMMKEDMDD